VSIPVFLSRWELPLSVMTSAWWTTRSIIAAATTWSPNTSPQRAKGRFDVRISEACSERDELEEQIRGVGAHRHLHASSHGCNFERVLD